MEFKRERLLAPVAVPCYDWKDEDGNSSKKTVIISPVHIIEYKDGSTKISWACSRGTQCKDKQCRYSHTNSKQDTH